MTSFYHSNTDWAEACQTLQQQGKAYCLATVVAEVGSLPRGAGAKMVISQSDQFDTLGGGQIEFEVIRQAREGLTRRCVDFSLPPVVVKRYALAADLGQCCGGAAQVMFEYINTHLPQVVIFGAGHVCHALCKIMAQLPCHLVVIDSRAEWLTSIEKEGVTTMLYKNPADAIEVISEHSHIVVMTHEHELDYLVVLNALERHCFPFIGLIGSSSKKQRFEQRFKEMLTDESLILQLTCPIGNPDVPGKLPMQVAVSISAQLIQLFEKSSVVGEKDIDFAAQQWKETNEVRKILKRESELNE